MKKLVYLLIAVSLVLALVPTVALAHTEDDPLVVGLLAGQTEEIGYVKVWNDADTLYVEFDYEGPDCGFLEVHLQVDEGTWSEDILTKKGNPIPGQFEESYKPGWCFDEHTFVFDLSDEDFEVGDTLKIAAHAALGLAETMTIVSDTSTDVVNGTVTPAVLANEPFNYPTCSSYTPDDTNKSLWDNAIGTAYNTFSASPAADWIWNTLDPVHPIEGDVVTFQKLFSVPGLPNGGTLYITADNGYQAMLNGVLLGSAQLGPGFPTTLKETTDTTPQAGNWGVASQGWQSVESYSLTELVSGENTLVIIAANEYMYPDDRYFTQWDPPQGGPAVDPTPGNGPGVYPCYNPAGLIFKATMDYYASGETAWGAGTRFTEDRNWATWFTYEVQPYCTNVPVVENGSFETPEVMASQGWDIFPSGTTDLDWTVAWVGTTTSYDGQTRPETAVLELQENGVLGGVSATDGDQYAELDTDWGGPGQPGSGEPASVAISQDLATCSGEWYTLEYAWRPRPGQNSSLRVYWDSNEIATHSGSSGGWTTASIPVQASGESTLLKFVEVGPEDSYGMLLDDVKIIVP